MKKEDIRMLYLLLRKASKLAEEMCLEMIQEGCENCPLGTGKGGPCGNANITAAEMAVTSYIAKRRAEAHMVENGE